MSYGSLAQLKRYQGITATEEQDDLLLTECLDRATSVIHLLSGGRRFEPIEQTRYYDAVADVSDDRRVLYCTDEDLIYTTAVVNGDGTTIPAASMSLIPVNPRPEAWVHFGIRLLDRYWTYTTDSFAAISVTGMWGWVERHQTDGVITYHTPQAVFQACMRMAGFFYKEKDSQVFETTGYMEEGRLIIPQGFPAGALDIIKALARKI